jgi:hypothetical protein
LKSYWKYKDGGETFDNLLNGWLPQDGIHTIANKYSRFIILIYLDSETVEMFFPEKTHSFFIHENELVYFTFKQLFEKCCFPTKQYKLYFGEITSIDLPSTKFLKLLYEVAEVIGLLTNKYEYGYYKVFKQFYRLPKLIILKIQNNMEFHKYKNKLKIKGMFQNILQFF